MGRRRIAYSAIATVAMAGAIAASPAGAAKTKPLDTPNPLIVKGSKGPGPSKYNRVFVSRFGNPKAKRVVVLMPGTFGGAGDFTLAAKYLTRKMKSVQVWTIDRRTQALEDTSMFRKVLQGKATPKDALDYYLGWILDSDIEPHMEFLDGAGNYPFARDWGMKVALADARRVVLRATDHGKRKVILGGHSLGASLADAYAAWDFHGTPGYKDIDGLLLIDGGARGSSSTEYSLSDAQAAIADLSTSTPFAALLPGLPPESAGVFGEVGGLYARLDPKGTATDLQNFPLLPASLKPTEPATNRGAFGFAFDRDTSPAALSLIQVNGGRLATIGDPHDWIDGGVTPISRLARTFGQEPTNAIEWYFPKRLSIDTAAASALSDTEAAQYLGLNLKHGADIPVPLYAIQTSLSGGGVLAGARNLIANSKVPKKRSKLVNADPRMSHLDPLIAAPRTNVFFRTVIPFLRKTFK